MHTYPGADFSISQLLEALANKLDDESYVGVRARYDTQEIEHLEKYTHRVLAGLRSYQNAFTPVNRLDADSLGDVFQLVATHCHSKNSHGSLESPYQWMAVAQVCRYWRGVALAFSSTWSTIDSRRSKIARLCVERSGKSPLHVQLYPGCPVFLFDRLKTHVPRIASLHFALKTGEQAHLYAHLKNDIAPELVSLSAESVDADNNCLPLLFKGHTPSLRHLRLSGLSLGDAWNHVNTLVTLELIQENPMFSHTMPQFLDFLESNTALQRIHLSSAGPRTDSGDPTRLVSLPYLQHVTLIKCATKAILGHLRLGEGAEIFIEDLDISSTLQEALPNTLDHLSNISQITSLGMRRHAWGTFSLYTTGPSGSMSVRANSTVENLQRPIFPETLGAIPSYLALGHVKDLWLHCATRDPTATEANLLNSDAYRGLSAMPALETLVLLHCRSENIIQVLQSAGEQIVCPALENLVLYDDRSEMPIAALLVELAEVRKALGVPLKRVSVIGYPGKPLVPPEQVMSLKPFVKAVEYKVDNEAPESPFVWFK